MPASMQRTEPPASSIVGTSSGSSRAERSIVALGRVDRVNSAPRQYVNRLSDLLFVFARVLNRADGGSDVLWNHERRK